MITIKNGNIFKKKRDFVTEKFQTKSGLFDYVIGTIIWSFLIVQYSKIGFDKLRGIFGPTTSTFAGFFIDAFTYLIFGVALTFLGLGITYVLRKIFDFIHKQTGWF